MSTIGDIKEILGVKTTAHVFDLLSRVRSYIRGFKHTT